MKEPNQPEILKLRREAKKVLTPLVFDDTEKRVTPKLRDLPHTDLQKIIDQDSGFLVDLMKEINRGGSLEKGLKSAKTVVLGHPEHIVSLKDVIVKNLMLHPEIQAVLQAHPDVVEKLRTKKEDMYKHAPVSAIIDSRFICGHCGKRGATVRALDTYSDEPPRIVRKCNSCGKSEVENPVL